MIKHTKIIVFFLLLNTYFQSFTQITLDDVFNNGKFNANGINEIKFLNTKNEFVQLENNLKQNQFVFYNQYNDSIKSISISKISSNKIKEVENFSVSNTDKYFLFYNNADYLYRRTFTANYFITDGKKIQNISTDKIMLPSFSPDDSKIAFIKNNNIFYVDVSTKNEIQITSDGSWNTIINGKSDWVYEEEFQISKMYEWNKNSNKIAYLKLDETDVPEYTFPIYGNNYPYNFTYKYPKVGEKNSTVNLYVYDLKSKKNKKINLTYNYEYIPRLYWNNEEIIALLLNKHQDTLQLISYNINTKITKQIYFETSSTYVNIPNYLKFLNDKSFVISSEKDGFNHLYHYTENGKLINQITNGNFEIFDVYGIDETKNTIFYQANKNIIAEKQIFATNYTTTTTQQLTQENGTHTAQFSNNCNFFLDDFSAHNIPNQISIKYVNETNKSIIIEQNNALKDSIINNLPIKKFNTISVNNTTLENYYIEPKNFDSNQKYPLLMYVYGGPGNQEVENKWNARGVERWLYFMAENGYYVVCTDNRGSGGKGTNFKKQTYLNLGKMEAEDQIAVAKFYAKKSFIDSTRIGIMGWSYGGYLSALCLMEGNAIFKTAVSIAPVANWKYYDNIYTERFMRTVEENKKGYENFNLINSAKKLKGNLFLAHGTADDNVHFQNMIELIEELNTQEKEYQLYIYPNKKHGINVNNSRLDLFKKISNYLFKNL